MTRPDPDKNAYTEPELRELRDNLSKLSGPSVLSVYRDAHRECATERKPGAKAIQRLVTAWKVLSRWGWR